jgi:hypothetical protein
MDPDPAIFIIDLQDANKKRLFCLFLFEGTVRLHHFSKIKSQKATTLSLKGCYSYTVFFVHQQFIPEGSVSDPD